MMELYQELLKRRNPAGSEAATDGGMEMLLQQLAGGAQAPTGMKPKSLANDYAAESDHGFESMSMQRLQQPESSASSTPKQPAMGKPMKKSDTAAAVPKAAAASATVGGGGGGLMEMLQGMMRGGRPADVPHVEEEAADGTCAGGSCLAEDRPPPRGGKATAARGKDPATAAAVPRMKKPAAPAAAAATQVYDALCQQQFGEFAVYDGADGCACIDGYALTEDGCAPVSQQRGGVARLGGGGAAGPSAELIKVVLSPPLLRSCPFNISSNL